MNEEKNLEVQNVDYIIKNDQDADYVISKLKDQLQYHKNKNSQYDTTLSKLKLSPDTLSFTFREILNNLSKLQEVSGVHNLESVDIEMSYLEYANARLNYQDKINIVKAHYEDLCKMTDDVIHDTEIIERELSTAKLKIDSIALMPNNELQKLKLQIKSYEDKLLQHINKYPWINDPEYNLLSIQEEIKKVYRLQDEIEELKKSTEYYCGLKPDIIEAKNQLHQIKTEYNNMSKMKQ